MVTCSMHSMQRVAHGVARMGVACAWGRPGLAQSAGCIGLRPAGLHACIVAASTTAAGAGLIVIGAGRPCRLLLDATTAHLVLAAGRKV
jgi:hypothetical protein